MKHSNKILLCLLLLMPFLAEAQYNITAYQRNDGLPANLTKTTIQDDLGFIWIGTDLGLVRYDGQEFIELSEGLPSPYVKSFFKTRDRQLVAITDGGMVSVISKPDSVSIQPYTPLSNGDSLETQYPKEGQISCDGSMWITEGGRISRVRGNGVTQYEFNISDVNFLRSQMLWEEGCGEIFVALPNGTFAMFDSNEEDFVPLAVQVSSSFNVARKLPKLAYIDFHAMMRAEDGRIVMSSNIGLLIFRIDPVTRTAQLEDWAMQGVACSYAVTTGTGEVFVCTFNKGLHFAPSIDRIKEAEKVEGLPFQVTNYAYVDNQDNVWVNGDGGVAVLQKQFFAKVPVPEEFEVYNYNIGEDHTPYLINSEGHLYELIQEASGRFRWEFRAKGLFAPNTSPMINAQLRYVIRDGVFYACDDTRGVVWRCDKEGKEALAIPELKTPNSYVKQDQNKNLWIDGDNGTWKRSPDGNVEKVSHPLGGGSLFTIPSRSSEEVYFSILQRTENYLYRYNAQADSLEDISIDIRPSDWEIREDIAFLIIDIARDDKGDYWLASSIGLFRISNGVLRKVDLGEEFARQPINKVLPDGTGGVWVALNIGLIYYNNGEIQSFSEADGLPTTNVYHEGLMLGEDGHLWVTTPIGLAYSQQSVLETKKTAQPIFTDISINGAPVKWEATENTPYQAYVRVGFTAPSYPSEKVQYRYRLNKDGKKENWSDPSLSGRILLPQINEGVYTLQVQAKQRGNFGWSQSSELEFKVSNIWYKTWWGLCLILLAIVAVIYLSIYIYGARLREKQRILEKTVAARTKEIQSQKVELQEQKENLQGLHEDLKGAFHELQKQKEDNDRKTKNITASINYASRIQGAILPGSSRLSRLLNQHFVFYKPRDIVSGDFYWCNAREQHRTILAVADCTGHGVPGAFMSMIGGVLLDQAVFVKGLDSPEMILQDLNQSLQKALNQEGQKTRDGMDISICVIDTQKEQLEFASAKGQAVYISEGKPHRLKGDNCPVGGEHSPIDQEYTLKTFPLRQIEAIYLFTDGFQDQFGGPLGRKFFSKNFRNMLSGLYNLPVSEQKSHLEFTLNHWTNPTAGVNDPYAQLDDILVVGVKLDELALPLARR